MVRVFLKGGVWKNSEDEILKAAVQKYGKQSWGRVSSLLSRKTAAQCKARWIEFIDPSIKKTDWSREEEEKLLHLAKLLPAQWKTIAPLVGRTSHQCQEHYERLLDQAASGEGGDVNDLRKAALRPGQIDAHPETKPARPDPIDMDEDELEMLQEARARLANTQGKKAKRKEREKVLLQAKRLADLQKRRELKQAGLLSKRASRRSRKKRKEIDLGVEIPFHKPAPSGFHDVTDEVARSEAVRNKRLRSVDFQKINENQYRSRDAEALRRQKQEAQRLKIIQDSAQKYGKPKEEEAPARQRGVLKLPEPMIGDAERAEMTKAQQQDMMMVTEEGSTVTKALLGDYSDRPLPTPMRQQDGGVSTQQSLLREASQMRTLERGQTPLLQANGPDAGDLVDEDMDRKPAATAVDAATPLPDRAGIGRTPRDQFGLNQSDAASVGTFASTKYSIRDLARQERQAAKRARRELELALAKLPAPQFEYDLAAPNEVPDDDEMVVETVQEDRADVEAAVLKSKEAEAERLYQSRSTVLKREILPRPTSVPDKLLSDKAVPSDIEKETLLLLQHDAHSHPIINENGKKRKRSTAVPRKVTLETIPDKVLQSARKLLQEETTLIVNEKVANVLDLKLAADRTGALTVLTEANLAASREGATDTEPTSADALRNQFSALKESTASMAKKNSKAESKLKVVNGGYVKRSAKLREESLHFFQDEKRARIEEAAFSDLQAHERQGAANRIEALQAEIRNLKDVEAKLQKSYGDLKIEKRRKMMDSQG